MNTHKTPILTLSLLAAASLLSAQPSITSHYNFQIIDHPGAFYTFPLGVNDHGVVAGFFGDFTGVNHGFLWKNGAFIAVIDFPGAAQTPGAGTDTGGITNRGDVVGTYIGTDGFQHGFKMTSPEGCGNDSHPNCQPVFTNIDVPGAAQTQGIVFEFGFGLGTSAMGISNNGAITGMYATNGLYSNAFMLSHGRFMPIDSPSASHLPGDGTKCFSINDNGAMACDYVTQSSSAAPQFTHGFMYDDGRVTPIFVAGSEAGGFGTQVNGINASKRVVGTFTNPTGALAGLVWDRGDYFTLNYPGSPFTELHSINARGSITGAYATDPFGQDVHGFIALPK